VSRCSQCLGGSRCSIDVGGMDRRPDRSHPFPTSVSNPPQIHIVHRLDELRDQMRAMCLLGGSRCLLGVGGLERRPGL